MEQAVTGHRLPLTAGDLVARPDCPVCGASAREHFRRQPYGKTAVADHFLCSSCGLTYLDPVPTQDWYGRLYGEEFWELKSSNDAPSGEVWANERQWHKSLARAEKYLDILRKLPPSGPINAVLEVGASFGVIGTTVASAYGADAFGVEPNHAAREFASRASGMTMVGKTVADLEEWQAKSPVDLAIFSHVLENIVDPAAALTLVYRKLRPGGLLLIEMSNCETRPSTSIYHPNCFSASSLLLLLEKCGFRIVRVSRSGRPTSIVMPLYLTVVAEAATTPMISRIRSFPGALVVKMRHFLYRIFYKSPFGKIDLKLTQRRWFGTLFVKRGVIKLKENLGHLRV